MEQLYIGGYSDKGINICKFCNGKIESVSISNPISNPSFLHLNNSILYAVLENEKHNEEYGGGVAAFKINENELQLINAKCTNGVAPCYLTTDKKREKLFVASYGDGSICIHKLESSGEIGEIICEKKYNNAHMHFIKLMKNEQYVFMVDLGMDLIRIYKNGKEIEENSIIKIEKKSEPRHFITSKDEKYLYLVTEHTNMLYVYSMKDNTEIELIQKLSTLPINVKTESFAGAIKISKDEKYLYVSNRGHNSISVFSINNSKAELIQNISCGGDFPRDIALNNTEEYMLVANQKSNNVTVLKRNAENGKLSLTDEDFIVGNPACILFAD